MYKNAEDFVLNKLLPPKGKSPRRFILGTDWWTDCDDVMALKMLCWAHKNRIIKLEGIEINACMEYSAASVGAFVENEGLKIRLQADHEPVNDGVRIAIDISAPYSHGKKRYQENMARSLTGIIKSNADAENPVRMYRSIITEAPESVEIAEIGFLQSLVAFLESGPDDISPLSGYELAKNKVKKLWIMGGKWDEQGGREYNLSNGACAAEAAEKVCRLFPGEITFLGFEVGEPVISGGCLKGKGTLAARAMSDSGMEDGRSSWDPMLALLAVCGDEKIAGYSSVKGTARVDAATGENYFELNSGGKHRYVVKDCEDEYYSRIIDYILLQE